MQILKYYTNLIFSNGIIVFLLLTFSINSFAQALTVRNAHSMVYDSKLKQTILFSGHNGTEIYGDLWIFQSGKWYKAIDQPKIKRIPNGH